jgi:hypothetical protein
MPTDSPAASNAPRKRRKRKKLELAEPREIKMAIYSLTTRGKHARSHIEQELREIIDAAKSQLADYQKGLRNRRRHGHRTEKDLAARKAWFDAMIAAKESYKPVTADSAEEHEWKSLEEYKAWIHESTPAAFAPSTPPVKPVKLDADGYPRGDDYDD